MNLDLIGLRRNGQVVAEPDLRHHEAVLLGELAAHLRHALRKLAVGLDERRRNLLAQAQLDLDRLERLPDRIACLLLGYARRFLDLCLLGRAQLRPTLRYGIGDEAHDGPEQGKGKQRQPRRQRQDEHDQRSQKQGTGIVAELSENGLFGRAARAALRDQQTGRQRDDQSRDLGDETVADGQRREYGCRIGRRHAVAGDADDDAAEHIDCRDDDAGDGVATHELGGAVHGAEEGAFLLQLAATARRLLLVDQAGIEIGIDGHLLAGYGVEREPRADLGDARRALGDDHEVHRDQDDEHDGADDEIAAHHEVGEAGDDVPGGLGALAAVGEDEPRRGDVEGQPEQGGEQQHGRESREIQGPLDPQRHHENEHRKRDGERQADVDEGRRQRQEQHRQDEDDAYGKAYILGAGALDGLDAGGC